MISRQVEPVTKVITLGQSGVGKTSLISRIHAGKFTVSHEATVGCTFYEKIIDGLNFEFWDTAGQERYRAVVPIYYRGADVVILVFDVSDDRSLEEMSYYISILSQERTYSPRAKFIVVGNKTDLRHKDTAAITQDFQTHPMMKMCGFSGYTPHYISVKDNENVDEIVAKLLDFAREFALPEPPKETVELEEPLEQEASTCSC